MLGIIALRQLLFGFRPRGGLGRQIPVRRTRAKRTSAPTSRMLVVSADAGLAGNDHPFAGLEQRLRNSCRTAKPRRRTAKKAKRHAVQRFIDAIVVELIIASTGLAEWRAYEYLSAREPERICLRAVGYGGDARASSSVICTGEPEWGRSASGSVLRPNANCPRRIQTLVQFWQASIPANIGFFRCSWRVSALRSYPNIWLSALMEYLGTQWYIRSMSIAGRDTRYHPTDLRRGRRQLQPRGLAG